MWKQAKVKKVAYPRLFQPLLIPNSIWKTINMGFVEGLPKSEGKDTIIVKVKGLLSMGIL